MRPNVIRLGTHPATSRPILRALVAASLLIFAAVIAPIWALMIVCTMPCCEGESTPFVQSAAPAACAEHCGISSNTASHELPDAVPASSETPQFSFAGLAIAVAADTIVTSKPPRIPAPSAELQHAIPGGAPLYVYNSVFLI
jgi:hypothetical protein